jgi:hypothetical protein
MEDLLFWMSLGGRIEALAIVSGAIVLLLVGVGAILAKKT